MTSEDGSLFEELLRAPDRDHCPGARPVVSFRDDDESEFLDEIDARTERQLRLSRRGIDHGNWAEASAPLVDPQAGLPLAAVLAERWHNARPLVWRGLIDTGELADEIAERRRLFDELQTPGGLRRYAKAKAVDYAPHFELRGRKGKTFDERDVELVLFNWLRDPDDPNSPRMKDLWAKSAWLSTHADDASLRLRVSFGREVDDDASRDNRKHKRVAELANVLLPEAASVSGCEPLTEFLAGMCGGPTYFTQHIAYWNAPEGGALFHHDAFNEDATGGQRGVCYTQLYGSTAWLALSIDELTHRVIEFGEYLAEGELPWVRSSVFRRDSDFDRFLKQCKRFTRLRRELARPGCGSLGALVNRGPEFTSFLADAGHALILDAGDVLVLPNHGYDKTTMHSVFCASNEPTYAVSLAIRESHPPLSEPEFDEMMGAAPEPGGGFPSRKRARRSDER